MWRQPLFSDNMSARVKLIQIILRVDFHLKQNQKQHIADTRIKEGFMILLITK